MHFKKKLRRLAKSGQNTNISHLGQNDEYLTKCRFTEHNIIFEAAY